MERDWYCEICGIELEDSSSYRVNGFQMACFACCQAQRENKPHGYRDEDYDDWKISIQRKIESDFISDAEW